MLRIGLTGGIGSGKSTVSHLFSECGAPVIDADDIVHQLTAPDTHSYQHILDHFGDKVLHENGQINRPYLAQLVFSKDLDRHWLEALLHPAVAKEINQQLESLKASYVILAIPLLIEANWCHKVDRICVVDINEQLQQTRLLKHRKLSLTLVQRIMQVQISRKQRLSYADDIIDNQGDPSQLEPQVKRLDALYRQLTL